MKRNRIPEEGVDPIEEIRAIRRDIARRFKTVEAYAAYLQALPSPEALLKNKREAGGTPPARSRTRSAEKKTGSGRRGRTVPC